LDEGEKKTNLITNYWHWSFKKTLMIYLNLKSISWF